MDYCSYKENIKTVLVGSSKMPDSGIMTTGWQQISGKWYYMKSSGIMTTGWQVISGKWYYFDASGVWVR